MGVMGMKGSEDGPRAHRRPGKRRCELKAEGISSGGNHGLES